MKLNDALSNMRPYEQAAIEGLKPIIIKTYFGLLVGVWVTIVVGGLNVFPQGTTSGSVYRLGEDTNALTLIMAALVGAAGHAMASVLFGQDWRVSPRQLYGVYAIVIAMATATLPVVLALLVRVLPIVIMLAILTGAAFALYWRFTGEMPPFLQRKKGTTSEKFEQYL